ncbi:RecQ family ATP-dependent DNA helicase [Colletotrichum chrysophilum]|uniref:RecQ family ATP-dependent DNA helicase n=1 Tax=Colletotrichum chrysophilum TaxID=1836956 RepID=A0AAD8ZXG3_9PEZI|nr:RecQ family ATP-dependent DNA helicase [Colletotrichum chrysophilum]
MRHPFSQLRTRRIKLQGIPDRRNDIDWVDDEVDVSFEDENAFPGCEVAAPSVADAVPDQKRWAFPTGFHCSTSALSTPSHQVTPKCEDMQHRPASLQIPDSLGDDDGIVDLTGNEPALTSDSVAVYEGVTAASEAQAPKLKSISQRGPKRKNRETSEIGDSESDLEEFPDIYKTLGRPVLKSDRAAKSTKTVLLGFPTTDTDKRVFGQFWTSQLMQHR